MDEKEIRNNIPCIIDNGILYNPRDIQKVLRDIGHVSYSQIIDGEVKSSGEGYIISVVLNDHSANIIANKRIYLNVSGFEYLELKTENGESFLDLVEQFSILRLKPLSNPLTEESNSLVISRANEYLEDDFDESFAEINMDDDFDED